MRWTVALLCSLAGMHAAAAQPAPVPVDERGDAAWQLYHDAFAALMQGEPTRARALASTLLRDHPDHPAALLVRGAQLGLAPGASREPRGDERDAPAGEARETASRAARAELALFQSLHGIALGIETCLAVSCESASGAVGLALAGGVLGAVIPLNVPALTSGQRALLNSGTAWGAINAALALTAASPDEERTIGLALIGGQAAGLIAGAGLFAVHPTAGQVALANSGGQWVGIVSGLVLTAAGNGATNRERAITALVSIDAGLAAGAYLAARWPAVSRAQTLVIDAGGIVGAVGGGGLGVVIGRSVDDRTTPALAAVGAVIGLGAAAYLTRDWSAGRTSSLHSYVAPPTTGRGAIAGVAFTW